MFKYNLGDKVYVRGMIGVRTVEARNYYQNEGEPTPSVTYRTYTLDDKGYKFDRHWFGETQLSDVDCS